MSDAVRGKTLAAHSIKFPERKGIYMLNKIAQVDVYNGVGLVSSTEIMKLTQLKQYYKNQGFKEKRIDSIINIMLNNHLAYQIKGTEYIVSSPMVSYQKYNSSLEKAIWLYISSVNTNVENDIFNFHCKYPAVLFLSNKEKLLSDITCFYIRDGEEATSCRTIDTNYNIYGDKQQNIIVIIDDVKQIEKIKLPDVFKILYYVVISTDGNVTYYNFDEQNRV